MLSAVCFNLDQYKILSSGNGLNISVGSVCDLRTGYWLDPWLGQFLLGDS